MRGTSVLAPSRAPLFALALLVAVSTGCPKLAEAATKRTDMTPFAYNTSGVVGIGAAPASVDGPAILQFQGVTGASYDPAYGHPIPLGQFVVNPSAPLNGQGTIYSNTPFEIEIQAPSLDKTSTFPVLGNLFPGLGKSLSLKTLNENSVILKGTLTGTVSGTGQANVVATVNTVKLGSLDASTQDHITHYTFPIHFSQLKLPAGWVMAGTTAPTQSSLPMIPATSPTTSPTISTSSTTVAAPQFVVGATTSTAGSQTLPAPLAESGLASVGIPTPTPEPSTILIFATAFAGLALAHHQRRGR
jgi:hypothetical protein